MSSPAAGRHRNALSVEGRRNGVQRCSAAPPQLQDDLRQFACPCVRRSGVGLAAGLAGLGLLADDGHGDLADKTPCRRQVRVQVSLP
jgi:hypothetical protein